METTGRNANGTFSKGHRFGKGGNPYHKEQARLRAVLYERVSDEDFREMVERQVELAKGGDKVAFKILVEHLIGKPIQAVQLSGPEGEKLEGVSIADVQLAVIEALSRHPQARAEVAEAFKSLYDRSRSSDAGTPA
jgi:hypothetical protein